MNMFCTTIRSWGEKEKNVRLSKNAGLFLERALKGLYSSLWQQHGFAMQTVHILRLTPVNWAGRLTQVRLSLESSMLPQSQMTARRDWDTTFLWPDGGPKRSFLKDRFVSGFVGSVWCRSLTKASIYFPAKLNMIVLHGVMVWELSCSILNLSTPPVGIKAGIKLYYLTWQYLSGHKAWYNFCIRAEI